MKSFNVLQNQQCILEIASTYPELSSEAVLGISSTIQNNKWNSHTPEIAGADVRAPTSGQGV